MKKFTALSALLASAALACAQQNPLNGNFEDTLLVANQNGFDTLSRHWSTSGFGAGISTDAAGGKHAAYIWNWYYYGKGILSNGASTQPGNGGTPIGFRPTALNGFYKYLPGNVSTSNDSAVVYISLTKYNTITKRRDTLGKGERTFPLQASYKAFQVPIIYTSASQPDTVSIRFLSSLNGFCSNTSDGNCLFFYVDDLTLTNTATGLKGRVELNHPRIYPNPVQDIFYIENKEAETTQARLYAIDGRLLRSWTVEANTTDAVNTREWPEGIYFLKFDDTGKTYRVIKN